MKINNSTTPLRCEICHQADCYDSETDRCSRCAQLKPMILSQADASIAPKKRSFIDNSILFIKWFDRISCLIGLHDWVRDPDQQIFVCANCKRVKKQ